MRYLFVDLISEWEVDHKIRGFKNVAMSEDYLEYHFPKFPIMPGVLLLESMAQLAGWLEGISSGFTRWVLIENVTQCKFYNFARPGDQVELEIEVVRAKDTALRAYRGVGSVLGDKRVVAEFEGRVLPLSELEVPSDQRALFERLIRNDSENPVRKGVDFL